MNTSPSLRTFTLSDALSTLQVGMDFKKLLAVVMGVMKLDEQYSVHFETS